MFTNRNETNGNKIILLLQKLMDKLWILFTCDQGKDSANLILGKVYWRCVFAMRNHLFESAKNKEKVVTFSLNNYILLKYIEFEYLLEDLLKV